MRRVVPLLIIAAHRHRPRGLRQEKSRRTARGLRFPPRIRHARDGGSVIRRLESECKTLNWVLYTTAYENFVLRYIYDPLIDYDAQGNLIPVLASELARP